MWIFELDAEKKRAIWASERENNKTFTHITTMCMQSASLAFVNESHSSDISFFFFWVLAHGTQPLLSAIMPFGECVHGCVCVAKYIRHTHNMPEYTIWIWLKPLYEWRWKTASACVRAFAIVTSPIFVYVRILFMANGRMQANEQRGLGAGKRAR